MHSLSDEECDYLIDYTGLDVAVAGSLEETPVIFFHRNKNVIEFVTILKQKLNPVPPKATYRKKKKRTWTKKQDFKWLPKYQPTYVDR